ncbi:MAG TPA: NFACT RNA binding domain-containing protein [Pyrinomonadaceae bacterium]
MHQQLIQSIVEEVRVEAVDHFLGRIVQLGPLSLALDVGLRSRYLYLSSDPASPRFYLVERKGKELEKQSTPLSHFGQLLKAQLGGGRFVQIRKDRDERVVRMTFRVEDDLGEIHFRRLVVQLTGRAANLFILDELNRIVAALRAPKGHGQNIGELYLAPPSNKAITREDFVAPTGSPSTAADEHFHSFDAGKVFDQAVGGVRGRIKQSKDQKVKLQNNLTKDLEGHGDPEVHKRIGDLLLANISTAVRDGNKVLITDFYADDAPTIEVELEENETLQEAASKRFRQYTKAKRAQEELAERLRQLAVEISSLEQQEQEIDRIARERDEAALARLLPNRKVQATTSKKSKPEPAIPGVRRYQSSDGYEILVGRTSRDNDNLTFRIARPNDLWLHAGDYPGSHVVVRNSNRTEIPQRTVIEAAQLAGRFSQASEDTKVVVHYTQRKFISKPKGAAPGLVRLSSFRSITVEPKESVKRI